VCDYRRGLDWWINCCPHTALGTTSTSNYSAIANLHIVQITTRPLLHSAVSSTAVSWQRLVTVEILQFPELRFHFYSLLYRIPLDWQLRNSTNSHQPPGLLFTGLPSVDNTLGHSQSYFMTGVLPPISSSWRQVPWDSRPAFSFRLNICFHNPYVTSSLTRGWVCILQLLLALVIAVILRSESCGTLENILLSQIRGTPA
jgi:hypothetical protein